MPTQYDESRLSDTGNYNSQKLPMCYMFTWIRAYGTNAQYNWWNFFKMMFRVHLIYMKRIRRHIPPVISYLLMYSPDDYN